MNVEKSTVRGHPPAMVAASAELPAHPSRETLCDGTSIIMRGLKPDDFAAVLALADHLSGDELYLRFFTFHPRYLAEWAHSVTEREPGRVAIGAFDGETLLAVGNLIPTAQPGTAEIAIVVAHHHHGRGIATLLLTQLAEHAKSTGAQRLVADVLTQNVEMRRVIADAGWPCTQHRNADVIAIEVDLTEISPTDLAAAARTRHLSAAGSAR